jgi:hypothetical protein
MKRIVILLTGICMSMMGMAQTDTTRKDSDTIRIGSMIIVKKGGGGYNNEMNERQRTRMYRRSYKPSAITTNWFIVDLGFANYTDNTNYSDPAVIDPTFGFAPNRTKNDFKLRTGKSSNVNIWLFMQRLNIAKNVVNLKYGLGIETNNYRYKEPILYETEPIVRARMDQVRHYKKNKLAADYVTVPMLLNFNFTPNRRHGFGISVGASAGYLYSSRQKTVTDEDGKEKTHDDFNLNKWKISYIGEVQLGPVKLYGSLATKSIFESGLDQTPYAVGIRFSSW